MPKGVYKRTPETKRKMSEANSNENHPRWKGDNVKKTGLHQWMHRHKPIPEFCEHCGVKPPKDCANKDHSYKRNIEDFMWLCKSCHVKYDIEYNGRPKNQYM